MTSFTRHTFTFLSLAFISSNIAQASVATIGELSYNTDTQVISGPDTTSYLGSGVLAELNHAQTVAITAFGGEFSNYHIASQAEAYTFFNYASYDGDVIDGPGMFESFITASPNYQADMFGSNFESLPNTSFAMFYSNAKNIAGVLQANPGRLSISEQWDTIVGTDVWSGVGPNFAASWLLVSDELKPVPVPTAVWFMGSGLLGLAGVSRKRHSPSVSAV